MMSLRETLKQAAQKQVAVGHFNVSDDTALKAIFNAARARTLPIMIGTSEGERDYIGVHQVAALVRSLREQYDYPIFLNADHTHSFQKAKEAVEAGYDEVLFDGGKLSLDENIAETKKVVAFVKEYNAAHGTDVMVEGELGYIGSSSVIFDELPQGAALLEKDFTTVADATRFVQETGVDMLAPAIGNIHGMFRNGPNPDLAIDRIKDIAAAVRVPLVLHGGSGIIPAQFQLAIKAGMNVVHINTEIRQAWRRGFDTALLMHPDEIVPYKVLPDVIESIEHVVGEKLDIFNFISPPAA